MSKYFGPTTDSTLHDRLFSPLFQAHTKAKNKRSCKSLPDSEWLEAGVRRCLSSERTGRGFLDYLEDVCDRTIGCGLFFESLKSNRRLSLLSEIAHSVGKMIDQNYTHEMDPFSHVNSLADFDIYSGDGHYVEHASHDSLIDGKSFATGDMFGLNLRSHRMFLLTNAKRGNSRKREHDMHALKRLAIDTLRQNAPTGRKVLWIWDRAGIDANFWIKLKAQHGIYFVSRAKENMKLGKMGDLPFDHSDPNNAGVTAFELVSVANQALRCVRYTCPVSGTAFVFLSTLSTVEPGVIAHLYRARWDIEKVFEVTKRKMTESKSWGTSEAAKSIHANFRALSHNLLLLLERYLESTHSIVDETEVARRAMREHTDIAKAGRAGRSLAPLARLLIRRATQRTLKFIRWVRNNIDSSRSWQSLLDRLRGRLGGKVR